MKVEFLTAEDVLQHLHLTQTQLSQLICDGQLPFHVQVSPSSAARILGLESEQMRTDITEYQSTKDEEKRARLFSSIMRKLGYLLFPADEVEKLKDKEPLQRKHKPRWDNKTQKLYGFDGKPHTIKHPAQLHALPILFKARGERINKQDLARECVADKPNWPFGRIAKKINDLVPDLIQGDGEKGYYIRSLRKGSE